MNITNKLGVSLIFLILIAFVRCSTIDVQKNKGCIWGDCVNGFGVERVMDPIHWWNDYIYVGEWKRNTKSGKGTYTDKFGKKYIGEWTDNKEHGQGILIIKDGVFSGEWKYGDMKGIFTYESKTVIYTGTFVRHREDPYYLPSSGEIKWTDGSRYKGDFGPASIRSDKSNYRCGFPNGHGVYTSTDGKVYNGDFSCVAYPPYPFAEKMKYYGYIQTNDGYYEFFLDVEEGKSPIQFRFREVKKR